MLLNIATGVLIAQPFLAALWAFALRNRRAQEEELTSITEYTPYTGPIYTRHGREIG